MVAIVRILDARIVFLGALQSARCLLELSPRGRLILGTLSCHHQVLVLVLNHHSVVRRTQPRERAIGRGDDAGGTTIANLVQCALAERGALAQAPNLSSVHLYGDLAVNQYEEGVARVALPEDGRSLASRDQRQVFAQLHLHIACGYVLLDVVYTLHPSVKLVEVGL